MGCHLRPRVLDGSRQVRKSDEMVLCPAAIIAFIFLFKDPLVDSFVFVELKQVGKSDECLATKINRQTYKYVMARVAKCHRYDR